MNFFRNRTTNIKNTHSFSEGYVDSQFGDAFEIIDPEIDNVYKGTISSGLFLLNKLINKGTPDTVIFLCPYAGTGDVYLSGLFMNAFARLNNITDYMVVVIGKSNYKIISLFDYDKIEMVSQEEADNLVRLSMLLGKDNDRIIVIHHDAPQVYCGILENMRNYNDINFVDLFLYNVFGERAADFKERPKFSYDNVKISKFMSDHDLVEGKTVVISPYVNTLPSLPDWVWVNLASKLKKLGYCVGTNCAGDEKEIKGTQRLSFDYSMSVPLLEKCGYFVGIRSGFCDVVSTARCRKIIVYQPYIFWGPGTNYDYFCLNKIGFCDDAIEFEYEGVEFLDVVDRIVNNITTDVPEKTYFKKSKAEATVDYVIIDLRDSIGSDEENDFYKLRNILGGSEAPFIIDVAKKCKDKKIIIIGADLSSYIKDYMDVYCKTDFVVVKELKEVMGIVPENKPLTYCSYGFFSGEVLAHQDINSNNYALTDSKDVIRLLILQNKAYLDTLFEDEKLKYNGNYTDIKNNCNINLIKVSENTLEPKAIVRDDSIKLVSESHFEIINKNGLIICEVKDTTGKVFSDFEKSWYKNIDDNVEIATEEVISYDPLIREECNNGTVLSDKYITSDAEKRSIVDHIIYSLNSLHDSKRITVDDKGYYVNCFKVLLEKLLYEKNIFPLSNERYIHINDRKCKNIFFCNKEVEELLEDYSPSVLSFIHGACNFSNIIVNNEDNPVFINPNRSFLPYDILGDADYDWACIYSSLCGDIESFLKRDFDIKVSEDRVEINIGTSHWIDMKEYFYKSANISSETKIVLLHSLMWFQLCSDIEYGYEAKLTAFYRGLYLLDEIM